MIETLGKVADMQIKPTSEPTRSPIPGVVPDPVRVHHDTAAAHERDGAAIEPALLRRRSPLAKLLSHLRGDKYMVGAYPPGEER